MPAPALPRAPRTLDLAELTELARSYADHPDRWTPVVRIPEPGEDRFWTRLESTDQADVWLLSWRPGHATDLHDHGDSAAAFSVVQGELTEVRITRDGTVSEHRREAGRTTWVAPGVIHDVHGGGEGPAVSIHAYSPPLTRMTFYRRAADRVEPIETVATQDPEQGPRR